MPYRVENIVRKGEIACYKQFLLFSQCFLQVYISLVRQNAALCDNGLTGTTGTASSRTIMTVSIITATFYFLYHDRYHCNYYFFCPARVAQW